MNLLFQALRQAVDDAAQGRGLESYRIVWKHNSAGDFVMAIVTSDPRLGPEKTTTPRERSVMRPRRD